MNQSNLNKIIFLIIIFIQITIQKNDYDLLLEWGKNNSLEISNKLEMKYISENNKTFYTKEKISENEVILSIPYSITLNIQNALKLYGKKAKNLFKEYKTLLPELKNDFILDQSFLAYIIYKVNKNNKTRKNKFYKFYQYLFNTYESNLDNFPIFYNREQMYLIQFTSLSYSINFIKDIYAGEIDVFENKLNLKTINKEEYYVFRTYASSKSYNISGHSVIVPFVDMFNKHPTKFNLRVEANEIVTKVIATKDILPSETLYIKYDYLTNHNSLTIFGITFDEIIDKVNSLNVPLLNPLLLQNYKIDIKDTNYNKYYSKYMDIGKDEFYTKFLKEYKKLSKKLKDDGTKSSAYKLILENLETIKELNEKVNPSIIYKSFFQQKDIDNILRIFKGEINFINKKINLMKNVINNVENKINNINKDL